MPKRVFWPAALVTMGIIFLASNLGLLPMAFWNLWPIILIVVGLGGLLISDREDWNMTKTPAKKAAVKAVKSKKVVSKKKK
ncbi:hypothetical protein KJZ63_05110 [Patescibacteria group bacterium]|nr:hypothetical protein [Patescibacteria group bacterium]